MQPFTKQNVACRKVALTCYQLFCIEYLYKDPDPEPALWLRARIHSKPVIDYSVGKPSRKTRL
jgi:hypothetical protein